jgi:cytochrome c peroxidase
MADVDPVPLDTGLPGGPVMPGASVKVASIAKATADAAARAAAEANVPQGGLDHDGRADTFQTQALGPLLDPNEMDNHSAEELLERIKRAVYADDLRKLFGANIFDQPQLALDEALFALVRFQTEDPSFHPYDSKYDAYLAGKAELSPAERRGLDAPYDRKAGQAPALNDSEIADIIAFLGTLTDGYRPDAPAVNATPER